MALAVAIEMGWDESKNIIIPQNTIPQYVVATFQLHMFSKLVSHFFNIKQPL